jgi:NADH-quinone oxidoreductase subunit F
MTVASNQEILQHWRHQPAPLLPMLHAFHERDGFLSEEAMHEISRTLRIPLAELFGTVTFYHHLSRDKHKHGARVCTGPVCCLNGGLELLGELKKDGAAAMPCAGRCDDPVPVLRDGSALSGTTAASLKAHLSPLPPPNHTDYEECVFLAIRQEGRSKLDGYRRTGGYDALTRAVSELQPADLIHLITDNGLSGRGGAGFPTGAKWKAVAEAAAHPKTVVCNADEGEPGCFKDRAILCHDPHAVLEGMALAAYATGATRGFIYLRYEYPEAHRVLQHAIHEAEGAGFLGGSILGSDFAFHIHLRRGAGAYICGEEGSLLNSLEGKHPFPRNRPPFPVTHGYENLPTVVNNVETLAAAVQLIRRGGKWYRNLGLNGHAGTKVISLSGDIARPGNYEVPLGLPISTLLYDMAGGPPQGRSIQAVTMAGLSGGFLAGDDLKVTLDEPSVRAKGSFLGAGGVMVFDDTRDMMELAHAAMEFFADESCGKCFPCRIGTARLAERLAGESGPKDLTSWIDEVNDIGRTMKALSACGLGIAAPLITESLIRYFPERVAEHAQR